VVVVGIGMNERGVGHLRQVRVQVGGIGLGLEWDGKGQGRGCTGLIWIDGPSEGRHSTQYAQSDSPRQAPVQPTVSDLHA
jgi:hypothetical protein